MPIAGARVLLRHDGDALSQAARRDTDAKGACSFQVNDAGNFAVLAQAKGFKPGGLKLHIGPGQPNRADVILLRATPDVQEQLVTVTGGTFVPAGQTRTVTLVRYEGKRIVHGFQGKIEGAL